MPRDPTEVAEEMDGLRAQRAAEADPPRPWRIIDPTSLDLWQPPEREWIVPDWLPVGHVTSLYGDGGVGKSLLAQQLMFACASGTPWCGIAVSRCRSLGLFCEDDEGELHRRQQKMNDGAGLTFADIGDMRWISGVGADNILAAPTIDGRVMPTPRFSELRDAAAAHGARLVVLDNAADIYDGSEIERRHVRRFIGMLTSIAQDLDAAVLLTAHPSRDGLRTGSLDGGSTAWSNSVRSRWSLARPAGDDDGLDTNERVMVRRKANYSSTGDTLRLRWAGGVLAPVTREGGIAGAVARAAAEDVFLALLDRCTKTGLRLSISPNAPNFAPRVFAKRPDAEGYTKRDFESAMHRLFASGAIINGTYGRPGDARQRITRAPAKPSESAT